MNSQTHLLDCPWCGGEVFRDTVNDSHHRDIVCDKCGLDFRMTDDQWNTRAPQPKPTGTEALVCEDIAARQVVGIKTHGMTVAENPLTKAQWRQNFYEELLDAAIYLKREMQEEQLKP